MRPRSTKIAQSTTCRCPHCNWILANEEQLYCYDCQHQIIEVRVVESITDYETGEITETVIKEGI